MSDPLHARMSTAIVAWLGDAVGDYARDLLANDMGDLVGTLEEHGVGVTLTGDSDE